jgi:hypothetical protein
MKCTKKKNAKKNTRKRTHKKGGFSEKKNDDISINEMRQYVKSTYVNNKRNSIQLEKKSSSIMKYIKKHSDNIYIKFINGLSKINLNNDDNSDDDSYDGDDSNKIKKEYNELKKIYSKKNQKCEERYRVNCKKSLNACTRSTNNNILGKVDMDKCIFDENLNEQLINSILYNVDNASECNTKDRPFYDYYRGRGYCSDTMPESSMFELLIKSERVTQFGSHGLELIYDELPTIVQKYTLDYFQNLVDDKGLELVNSKTSKSKTSKVIKHIPNWDIFNETDYSKTAEMARLVRFEMIIQVLPPIFNGINHFLYKVDEHGVYKTLKLMTKQTINCMKFIPIIFISQVVRSWCFHIKSINSYMIENNIINNNEFLKFTMSITTDFIIDIARTAIPSYATIIFDLYNDLMKNNLLSSKYTDEFNGANEELFFRSLLPKYLQGIKPHLYTFVEKCLKKTHTKKIDDLVNNIYLIFYCLVSGLWFGIKHIVNAYFLTNSNLKKSKKEESYHGTICQVVNCTITGVMLSYIEHHHNLATVWMLHFMNNYWAVTGGKGKKDSDEYFIM